MNSVRLLLGATLVVGCGLLGLAWLNMVLTAPRQADGSLAGQGAVAATTEVQIIVMLGAAAGVVIGLLMLLPQAKPVWARQSAIPVGRPPMPDLARKPEDIPDPEPLRPLRPITRISPGESSRRNPSAPQADPPASAPAPKRAA
ncbi:MAG: hypothetical protein AAF078_13370 [Planctomycetota bacterium]